MTTRVLSAENIRGLNVRRNYILNPIAENLGVIGWATYADAAGTRPVDGTGGSPNVTWTRSTSTPLRGDAEFLFTKDAANRQGQGVAYAFSIDRADQGKTLQIEFDYAVRSGTFAGGTTSDSDLIVYIYDVTNAATIEPVTFRLGGGATNLPVRHAATFSAATNSTSYRLIIHCATTSASAYTVGFDNFSVSPQVLAYDTESRVVALTVQKAASNHTSSGSDQDVGTWSTPSLDTHSAFNTTSGVYTCPVAGIYEVSGVMGFAANGTGSRYFTVQRNGSGNVILNAPSTTVSGTVDTHLVIPSALIQCNAGDTLRLRAFQSSGGSLGYLTGVEGSLSIQKLSGAAAILAAQTVVARVGGSATTITNTSVTKLAFNTEAIDTHSAFSSDTFTVPVGGKYSVFGAAELQAFAAGSVGAAFQLSIYKNGSEVTHFANPAQITTSVIRAVSVLDELQCVVGDTLDIRLYHTLGTTPSLNNNTVTTYAIFKRTGD